LVWPIIIIVMHKCRDFFPDAYIWTDVGVTQLPWTNSLFIHNSLGLLILAFDKVNLYKIHISESIIYCKFGIKQI